MSLWTVKTTWSLCDPSRERTPTNGLTTVRAPPPRPSARRSTTASVSPGQPRPHQRPGQHGDAGQRASGHGYGPRAPTGLAPDPPTLARLERPLRHRVAGQPADEHERCGRPPGVAGQDPGRHEGRRVRDHGLHGPSVAERRGVGEEAEHPEDPRPGRPGTRWSVRPAPPTGRSPRRTAASRPAAHSNVVPVGMPSAGVPGANRHVSTTAASTSDARADQPTGTRRRRQDGGGNPSTPPAGRPGSRGTTSR